MSDEWDPWRRTAGNIASAMMQLPALKAQAREGQARQAYYQAQSGHATAQAGKLDAETKALAEKGRLYTVLETSAPQAVADMRAGTLDSPAIKQTLGATAALSGQKPDKLATVFGQLLQQQQGIAAGDPTQVFAGTFGKPVPSGGAVTADQQQDALKNKIEVAKVGAQSRVEAAKATASRPVPLRNNAILVDAGTGNVIARGNQDLGIGHRLFAPNADLSYDQVAQGSAGNAFGSATPGSSIINRETGEIVGQVPSKTNPGNVPAGTKTKLAGLGTALAEAYKYNPGQVEKILQQIDQVSATIPTNAPTAAITIPKAEGRDPKEGRNPMAETRMGTTAAPAVTNAPTAGSTTGFDVSGLDLNSIRQQALAAIDRGKDKEAVRKRFLEMTGQEL